jgi:hypothetical protein
MTMVDPTNGISAGPQSTRSTQVSDTHVSRNRVVDNGDGEVWCTRPDRTVGRGNRRGAIQCHRTGRASMRRAIDADMDLCFSRGSPRSVAPSVWRASDRLMDGSAGPGRC